MGPVAWVREVEWFWQWPEPFVELVPLTPVAQLLRMGMDGEDLSCCKDDLPPDCEASVADGELCFGDDSEP